jgi:NAD(P)H dehydrogenase (quinone)
LTTAEIAGLVSEIANRPLAVVPVTPEALGQGLAAHGVPAFFVPVLVSLDVNTAQGNVAQVSDAVQRLTGRAPQRLADFLKTHRAELAA